MRRPAGEPGYGGNDAGEGSMSRRRGTSHRRYVAPYTAFTNSQRFSNRISMHSAAQLASPGSGVRVVGQANAIRFSLRSMCLTVISLLRSEISQLWD
jgi:hypothetical protein